MSLPEGLTFWALAGLGAVSFATAFISAAFGIGGGAAQLAAMAGLLPPAALVPVHGLVQLGANAGRAALFARHLNWTGVAPFLLGAALGAGLGGGLASALPPQAVQLGVAGFILWSVYGRVPVLPGAALAVGVGSGLLTMFFGATGPFVAAWLKTLKLERMAFMARFSVLLTAQHGVKTLAFAFWGFAFGPWLWPCALMILCGFAGTALGKQALMRIDEARFRLILNAALTMIALRLVWSALA